MDLFDPTLTALDSALGAAGLRQRALAQNIANVNTPGYQRVDVTGFAEQLDKALHSGGDPEETKLRIAAIRPDITKDQNVTVRADGSSVDPDEEMSRLAENNIQYNALVQLSQKKLSMLRYVISEGRR